MAIDLTKRNVWGTDISLIDSTEFCVECEHILGGHYTNCPYPARFLRREFNRIIALRVELFRRGES